MKKFSQTWKNVDRKGLKLSLIYFLNSLIKILFVEQFFWISAILLGVLVGIAPSKYHLGIVLTLIVLLNGKLTRRLVIMFVDRDGKQFIWALKEMVYFYFFSEGFKAVGQQIITNEYFGNLLIAWLCSLVIAIATYNLQPRLFNRYLFKNVIDKDYLGIRKFTGPLPPESNFYSDSKEADVDKRMRMINQRVIKEPYQNVVELSFLNREMTTAIAYKAVPFPGKMERNFIECDTIYYPVFRVYPFGKKVDFYHRLLQIKLSRNAAFTKSASISILKSSDLS
ncbi:TPA: hypothetical protein TZN93_001041 [Streptococcus suis]|uniref:hypothetical protein n=1 Tax=Streptococcus suis TaxID=1307 RepID=UPI000409EE4D|nr:hypothetical protein [Streptococcus suis]MCK4018592.1 hypothetical protein [Streptococcus suis]MCK4042041.1 hypothetical protein [Streptococcus suis]NQG58417.1 hypothetical protein [Streptococcus suis]NQM02408.1 hypothetical protein [Streptococcus suis]CYV45736.1 Uncharacterised protein [Streptococcus suis]